MTARVRDLDALGAVLDGIVAAGANEVHGAQMSASDPSASEHEALRAAVAAARAKAEAIADAAGVAVGRVERIEEEASHGPPMPKRRMMAMAEAGRRADRGRRRRPDGDAAHPRVVRDRVS